MATSIVAFPSMRRQLTASLVEQTAQRIGVAAGNLHAQEPVAVLSEPEQRSLRSRARMALAGRDWRDAELFAREMYSQQVCGRTFNRLSDADQHRVVQMAQILVGAARSYMQGDASEFGPTTRAWAMTEDEQILYAMRTELGA